MRPTVSSSYRQSKPPPMSVHPFPFIAAKVHSDIAQYCMTTHLPAQSTAPSFSLPVNMQRVRKAMISIDYTSMANNR